MNEGTLWLTIYPRKGFESLFGLPRNAIDIMQISF